MPMKKIFMSFIIAVTAIVIAGAFYACQKNNAPTSTNMIIYSGHPQIESFHYQSDPSNPMDSAGAWHAEGLDYYMSTVGDTVEATDAVTDTSAYHFLNAKGITYSNPDAFFDTLSDNRASTQILSYGLASGIFDTIQYNEIAEICDILDSTSFGYDSATVMNRLNQVNSEIASNGLPDTLQDVPYVVQSVARSSFLYWSNVATDTTSGWNKYFVANQRKDGRHIQIWGNGGKRYITDLGSTAKADAIGVCKGLESRLLAGIICLAFGQPELTAGELISGGVSGGIIESCKAVASGS
jgi:hypothetical protein